MYTFEKTTNEMAKEESAKTKGLKEGEERRTYIVNADVAEKLDAIAYWDRLTIKEVVNTALADYAAKYEKKNGPIRPVPKK
ncbi:MAG TPA: hypothetical protein VD794_08630 [Flavisolibacter sp.]|nr:hypothetical protein [Flavisolibacter sp.]